MSKVNHKLLLKKYMEMIAKIHGSTYVYKVDLFTEEEIKELKAIHDKVYQS